MKILVAGSKGQLGIDVTTSLSFDYQVYGCDRSELDITDEHIQKEQVSR